MRPSFSLRSRPDLLLHIIITHSHPSTPRFILRDFTYSSTALQKASDDFQTAEVTERELWTELLRLSRTNFSESFQVLVHVKVVRLFVESVLRYGLPAEYIGVIIKVNTARTRKQYDGG